ncbi:MAG: alpha/beta fold hydrolase [Gallionella sp.]|nr:alpha/beta fold hydrolase [Gallionella sp.]
MRTLISVFFILVWGTSFAQAAEFTYLGTQSVQQINEILGQERAAFLPRDHRPQSYRWAKTKPAKYPVDIYKVSYDSTIPEQNGRPTKAFGLIAIPKIDGASGLPVISYQHGTVYGKYEVPSYAFSRTNPSGYSQYEGAYETRLMVAQFGGQGYVVIAPDYFGMGDSTEPEAYMVKASTQQACMDFYLAAHQFLETKGLHQQSLFLGGWSLGGVTTTAFLEALEARNIPVTAAFTASAPSDPFAALNGLIYHPRKIDAPWSNTILALTVFSYENYYGQPGLAASVIRPEYYAALRQIYTREYANPQALGAIFAELMKQKISFKGYFQEAYADPAYLASSPYGKLLLEAETYRQLFRTPVRMYYGTHDEIVAIPVGLLATRYQNAMGNSAIESHRVEGGNHRATFLTAVSEVRSWLDGLRAH